MKVPELKAGMIIEYADGDLGIVFPKAKIILFRNGYIDFPESIDEREELFGNILAVYEIQDVFTINDCFDKKNLKCIWKRPEKEYKNFTEIAKALLDGKKLRCKHWHNSFYIHIKDNKLYENDIELSSLWIAYPMVEYKE